MSRKPPKKRAGQAKRPRRFDGAVKDVAGEAFELGVTVKTLRARVARGLIPYRKLGGRIVFLPDEVREFLRQLPGVTAQQALANVTARRDHPDAAPGAAR
jgi:Helix-turn-helix domain